MTDKTLLHPGDPFPGLIVNLPGGRTVHLPRDLAGRFGVVLFYRRPGHRQRVLQRRHRAARPQDVIGLIGYLRGTQLSRQEAPHGTATA